MPLLFSVELMERLGMKRLEMELNDADKTLMDVINRLLEKGLSGSMLLTPSS